MEKRMISRGSFLVIVTVIVLILIIGIIGLTSESVLHSEGQITGLVIISDDPAGQESEAADAGGEKPEFIHGISPPPGGAP